MARVITIKYFFNIVNFPYVDLPGATKSNGPVLYDVSQSSDNVSNEDRTTSSLKLLISDTVPMKRTDFPSNRDAFLKSLVNYDDFFKILVRKEKIIRRKFPDLPYPTLEERIEIVLLNIKMYIKALFKELSLLKLPDDTRQRAVVSKTQYYTIVNDWNFLFEPYQDIPEFEFIKDLRESYDLDTDIRGKKETQKQRLKRAVFVYLKPSGVKVYLDYGSYTKNQADKYFVDFKRLFNSLYSESSDSTSLKEPILKESFKEDLERLLTLNNITITDDVSNDISDIEDYLKDHEISLQVRMKELRNSKREYKKDEIVDIQFDAEMAKLFNDATNYVESESSFASGGSVPKEPSQLLRSSSSEGLRISSKEYQDRQTRDLKRFPKASFEPAVENLSMPEPPGLSPLPSTPPRIMRSSSSASSSAGEELENVPYADLIYQRYPARILGGTWQTGYRVKYLDDPIMDGDNADGVAGLDERGREILLTKVKAGSVFPRVEPDDPTIKINFEFLKKGLFESSKRFQRNTGYDNVDIYDNWIPSIVPVWYDRNGNHDEKYTVLKALFQKYNLYEYLSKFDWNRYSSRINRDLRRSERISNDRKLFVYKLIKEPTDNIQDDRSSNYLELYRNLFQLSDETIGLSDNEILEKIAKIKIRAPLLSEFKQLITPPYTNTSKSLVKNIFFDLFQLDGQIILRDEKTPERYKKAKLIESADSYGVEYTGKEYNMFSFPNFENLVRFSIRNSNIDDDKDKMREFFEKFKNQPNIDERIYEKYFRVPDAKKNMESYEITLKDLLTIKLDSRSPKVLKTKISAHKCSTKKVYKLQNAFKKTFKAYKDRFNAITGAIGNITKNPNETPVEDEEDSESIDSQSSNNTRKMRGTRIMRGGNKDTRKKKYKKKQLQKNTKY